MTTISLGCGGIVLIISKYTCHYFPSDDTVEQEPLLQLAPIVGIGVT